jgi:small subunit ribosomal protein S18
MNFGSNSAPGAAKGKKKRRLMMRRKRSLDPSIIIDYKKPDTLKRFITDRGKIIPRRISGATAEQQRQITDAVKKARYLSLIPYCVSHRNERGFAGEMSTAAMGSVGFDRGRPRGDFRGGRDSRGGGTDRGDRDRDHSSRSDGPRDKEMDND